MYYPKFYDRYFVWMKRLAYEVMCDCFDSLPVMLHHVMQLGEKSHSLISFNFNGTKTYTSSY